MWSSTYCSLINRLFMRPYQVVSSLRIVMQTYIIYNINQLSCTPHAPYFIIILCLTPDSLLCQTPDNFTCQGKSTGTHWVNHADYLPMCLVNSLSYIALYFIISLCPTRDDFTSSQGEIERWCPVGQFKLPLFLRQGRSNKP
jgi:hypothetical protein